MGNGWVLTDAPGHVGACDMRFTGTTVYHWDGNNPVLITDSSGSVDMTLFRLSHSNP
jgi:hypothetical protein